MAGLIATHNYASGDYRYTLLINTSMSTTRVALYTILTPLYGMTGATTVYLARTLVATILIMPKTREVKAPWSKISLSLVATIPLGIALKHLIDESTLTTIIIAVVYLLLTYLIHITLKLLRKTELIQLLRVLKLIASTR